MEDGRYKPETRTRIEAVQGVARFCGSELSEAEAIKEVAAERLATLTELIIDANDYDPNDRTAEHRSDMAKAMQLGGRAAYHWGKFEMAIDFADLAIEYMEGNR